MPKAYFKYVGGKQNLLPLLRQFYPPEPHKRMLFEPFCGAASVFFDIVPNNALLNDLSWPIACTHQMVRDSPLRVLHGLTRFQQANDKLPFRKTKEGKSVKIPSSASEAKTQEQYYYYQRHVLNAKMNKANQDLGASMAARFLFLIKTCHGGVWRVNKDGKMNCPWGGYEKPVIVDRAAITLASQALMSANISCLDFSMVMSDIEKGDFCYVDPPYDETYSAYTKSGFTAMQQSQLAESCIKAAERGAMLVHTNADTDLVRRLYTEGPAGNLFEYIQIRGPRVVSRDIHQRTTGASDALIVTKNLMSLSTARAIL